jgi:hypothetical protein
MNPGTVKTHVMERTSEWCLLTFLVSMVTTGLVKGLVTGGSNLETKHCFM